MAGPISQGAQAAVPPARVQRLLELLPEGWTLEGERFTPVDTAAGARARGQTLIAGCGRFDCRRRVAFDWEDLVRSPHKDTPFRELLDLLKCRHWRGCALELRTGLYPGGVPLISLVQHKDALIEIGCIQCPHVSRLSPAQVIDFLKRTKAGDGNTGVHVLGDTIRGRCPRCRGVRFWARAGVG